MIFRKKDMGSVEYQLMARSLTQTVGQASVKESPAVRAGNSCNANPKVYAVAKQ